MALQQTYERTNIYKDFDISFSNNPITGDVGTKSDANAIQQSIRTLINTNYYERPFQPFLGCNIRGLLFELATPVIANDIKTLIKEVLTNYEPRVIVDEVKVSDLSDQNAYNISIIYRIKSKNTINTFETVMKRLR